MNALWSCTGYKACAKWWIDAEQHMAVCSARFVCALLCHPSIVNHHSMAKAMAPSSNRQLHPLAAAYNRAHLGQKLQPGLITINLFQCFAALKGCFQYTCTHRTCFRRAHMCSAGMMSARPVHSACDRHGRLFIPSAMLLDRLPGCR